ncbi:MAG: 2-amino-4-hydroxy-6-hydroxymethyldihydropteridine diphosphokinase [Anaerolineales bacterium]
MNTDMQTNQNQVVFLSLGSNLGDRQKNLIAVDNLLPPQVIVNERSPIYETEPWGYQEQPRFLNQVLSVTTSLSPWDLLTYLKDIEKSIGRKPSFKYGPREVDIDILLYGDQVIVQENLIIPHERLTERAFVLAPLADLAPELILPESKSTIADILDTIDTSDVYLFQE